MVSLWESVRHTPLSLTILGTLGGKYGLVKSMLNSSTGIFSFQFSSMEGLDVMFENEYVVNVLVLVKLHGVPVTAFSEDGLSVIATNLGSGYVELKDIIVMAMPKLVGEGFYTCNVRVEYECKPLRCACCKVFGHVQDECPKNIDSDVVKNMKKPSQTPRDAELTIEVSNTNPFDVLNSVENDVDLGTNGGLLICLKDRINMAETNRASLVDPQSFGTD
ncbi:hypothetical protein Tco_1183793 [Tanacetum coccineum]